jgi:hypothetical protein
MTAEEKKRADALTVQLEERSRLLEQQKVEKKSVYDVMVEAAKNGADNLTLDRIRNAKTADEAIASAGNFMKAKDLQFVSGTENRQAGYFDKSTGRFTPIDGGAISVDTSEANATLTAYAQQYADSGKIPTGIPKGSFGTISQLAKELPKTNGTMVSRATGVTPANPDFDGKAYAAAYSAIELANQLKELDKKRIGGVIAGSLGKVFGSTDQQRYVDLRDQIVDLLARARSGAALTTTEEARYTGMLPSRFSEPLGIGANSEVRIDNFINTLTSDLKNKADTMNAAIYGLSTVKLGGNEYKIGDIITVNGMSGRVLPDGTIAPL